MVGLKRQKPELDRKSALDYFFIFGLPVVFVCIAFFGILWIAGPAPVPNPIQRLKAGAVQIGMSIDQVETAVGTPKAIRSQDDGSMTYRYSHGTSEPLVEEDGYVDFNASGRVTRVDFEKTVVTIPGSN